MFQEASQKRLNRSSAAFISILALLFSSAAPAVASETADRSVSFEVYSSFFDPCTFDPDPVIWEPFLTLAYSTGDARYDTEEDSFVEASFYMTWLKGSDSCGDMVDATGTVTASLTMSEAAVLAGLNDFTLLCRNDAGNSAGTPDPGCPVPNVYEVAAKITLPSDTAPGTYTGLLSVTWVP